MCTVGFDGNLPVTSFGWSGENASPSLQRNCDGATKASKLETSESNSYLLNAKLLLTDEFEELEVQSRESIAVVKIFLTDSEIVVAEFTEDRLNNNTKREILSHLRTHDIKEVNIEVDPADPSVMCLTVNFDRRFLYRITSGAATVGSWINRVFRLKRNSVSPSSAGTSTAEEREYTSLPVATTTVSSSHEHFNRTPLHLRSDSYRQMSHVPSFTESESESSSSLIPDETVNDCECDRLDNVPSKKSLPLKRRKAFRNSGLQSFRSRKEARSYSAPPDEKPEETTTGITSNGDTSASTSNAFESPMRESSMKKEKLKASPRVKKFTRALSARIIHTPESDNNFEESSASEVRRARSLNNPSSTLPRQSKKKEKTPKGKTAFFGTDSPPTTPGTPSKQPTPSKQLKSPGSILKMFNRRSTISSLSLEEYLSSMEEQDLLAIDVHNKPKQLKLYLQLPKLLAEELTLIDAEYFRKIEQRELREGAWTKRDKHSTSPNILKMIESFNRLAQIVCTEVVHEKTTSSRAKAITSYIKIASKLYKIHNYNSMKAVISGLQSQAVYRLEKSWNQVPSRRRRKFEKLSNFLVRMDSADQFRNLMQYNLRNNIQCIPFLGWHLTYTLHYQTIKKLEEEKGVVPPSPHCPTSSPRKTSRDYLSLPASPLHSDDEELEMHSVIENFSYEVLHFTKSLSDTDMQKRVKDSSSTDAPVSPREEVDFGCPINETRKFSSPQFLHPSAANVNPVTFSRLPHDHQSSSDGSVEESVQTDSAIGLDSSAGQPSPAHKRINGFVKPTNRQKTIQFSSYVQKKVQSESIPSLSDYIDNSDYYLPVIDCEFEDDESTSVENNEHILINSFMGASCSASSSHSPSIVSSITSPSMVSFGEAFTSQKPILPKQHPTCLLSARQHRAASLTNSPDYFDNTLSIAGCGILFSSCSHPMFDLPFFSFYQPGIPCEDIIKQVRDFFDSSNGIVSPKGSLVNLLKFSTPLNSMSNIAEAALNPVDQDSNQDSNQDLLTHSLDDKEEPLFQQVTTSNGDSIPLSPDNVFAQYQMNTQNYFGEFTSKQHMRYLINTVPWLDENQCHRVSMGIEPS